MARAAQTHGVGTIWHTEIWLRFLSIKRSTMKHTDHRGDRLTVARVLGFDPALISEIEASILSNRLLLCLLCSCT
jgi:hypothetical protein